MINLNNLFSKPATPVLTLGTSNGKASWEITAIRHHLPSEDSFGCLCHFLEFIVNCFDVKRTAATLA